MVTQASYYPGNVSKNTLYASKQYLTEWMKLYISICNYSGALLKYTTVLFHILLSKFDPLCTYT